MIYCIFINNRMAGYAALPYSSQNEEEKVRPVSEKDLIKLVGENWRDEYSKIVLQNGELIMDEAN
jgi:hypothetical protein